MHKLILSALVLTCALSCKSQPTGQQSAGGGPVTSFGMAQFEYTNFDEAGLPVVKGTITLPWPLPKDGQFQGTWQAKYSSNDDMAPSAKLGPQIGGGRCAGSTADGVLRLELNPSNTDNNVMFLVTFTGDSMSGEWSYSTFAGVIGHGSVQGATRR